MGCKETARGIPPPDDEKVANNRSHEHSAEGAPLFRRSGSLPDGVGSIRLVVAHPQGAEFVDHSSSSVTVTPRAFAIRFRTGRDGFFRSPLSSWET